MTRSDDRKSANKAFHRLCSIRYDVDHFLRPLLKDNDELNKVSVIPNIRCGLWYSIPLLSLSSERERINSCYFKSTDGHVHAFSLKRLNLELLNLFEDQQQNRIVIIDSSVRKSMPDSFSRTIPIWCTVLNQVTQRYRQDRQHEDQNIAHWDTDLYTPELISKSERSNMDIKAKESADILYQCQAIVNVHKFLGLMQKPLRPVWITPTSDTNGLLEMIRDPRFNWVICINSSRQSSPRVYWNETFWYTPGAADDEEAWAFGMTAQEFWKSAFDMPDNADEVDNWLQKKRQSITQDDFVEKPSVRNFDWLRIRTMKLAVGSRRAGRPPECWENFDAILNVTDTEYLDMEKIPPGKFYLQLPVKEGKRGDLEKWLSLSIFYTLLHLQVLGRRVLIHCAQGKDRSVAVALAVLLVATPLKYPLEWDFRRLNCSSLVEQVSDEENDNSGLTPGLRQAMQGRQGRDTLINFLVQTENGYYSERIRRVSKEKMRIALHLIRQDRCSADPSRSTMQKLNRFFMSFAYDPHYK